jgi:hypothetical protein
VTINTRVRAISSPIGAHTPRSSRRTPNRPLTAFRRAADQLEAALQSADAEPLTLEQAAG